jgi:uncharacterized protein (TIGR03089 family)
VHQLSTPEGRFAELVATDGTRPFVTYYDEATGERAELSVRSLANWVAKTHHLLGDELGLGVGDTAVVALPPHWISVPVVLGCLSAGLALELGGSGDVGFVWGEAGDVDAGDLYGIAPASAMVGFRGADPAGVQDYVVAVRPQADAWAGVQRPAGPDDAALAGRTRGELMAAAAGLDAGARVLTTRDWATPDDLVDTLFAALAASGSLVIVRSTDDEAVLARRAEQERATVRR